jgi:hypothetical protein
MTKEKLVELHHSLVALEQHITRQNTDVPGYYNHPDAVLVRSCEALIERLVKTMK